MPCWHCASTRFADISRAMAASASARLRRLGLREVAPNWSQRAQICETCPLRVVRRQISYCGMPYLSKITRDPTTDGCGCPTLEKAKSPTESCPRNRW
jgi:hypothetical protein